MRIYRSALFLEQTGIFNKSLIHADRFYVTVGAGKEKEFWERKIDTVKNEKLLPFSRNRYYRGKMLTSADFDAEQLYGLGKRQFMNRMVNGTGIICGLGVVNLDDLSLLVESGAAVDGLGREIVVESAVVKKLSAVTGFEQLRTCDAYLCIRYRETETQPVYALTEQEDGREYEYNRIEEGYELFLQDVEAAGRRYEAETEFFTGAVLLENADYEIRLKLPAAICKGHYVKIVLEVIKVSDAGSSLFYEGILQTSALSMPDGGRELHIQLENILLSHGQKLVKEYWMLAQPQALDESGLVLKPGSVKALIGGEEAEVRSGLCCRVNVVEDTPALLAGRGTGSVSMELRGMGEDAGFVALAKIALMRTDSAYLITQVDEKSVKTYIPTLRDAWKRMEYNAYFCPRFPFYEHEKDETVHREDGGMEEADLLRTAPRIETGIVEIPLGERARKGDICYSAQVMHGLGKGNVFVQVGSQYLEEQESGGNEETTVFGNPALFESKRTQACAEAAVKVLNDRGAFVVALRLLRDVKQLILTYRWMAVRCDSERLQEEIEHDIDRSISVVTPTVALAEKESYLFRITYHNMKPCPVSYELTEPGSGEVTQDGVYTAPSREGIYEIRIYCTDHPMICTYAYAIVKKKKMNGRGDL